MNQFSLKNLKLSPRASSTFSNQFSTPLLTPRSSQQGSDSYQSEILVKTSHLTQLLNQYDKDIVSEQNFIESLKKASLNLRKKETENQMTKQFANLNRIKQDNQRILKTRIKYLEERLAKVGEGQKQLTNNSSFDTNSLKQQINQKNKEITDLRNKIQNLENQIRTLALSSSVFQQEKLRLIQTIEKQELTIRNLKVQKSTENIVSMNKATQTDRFFGTKNLCMKCQVVNASFLPFKSEEDEDLINNKIEILKKDLMVLEASNSALRKQLVQIHVYMEEQDEKYQKTIEKLEQKIHKLTQFKEKPRSSSRVNSKSTLYSLTPRRRNSDLRTSTAYSRKQQQQQPLKGHIIKLADFKIKFELQKNNLDETQDTKFTLTSSRIE